jgi:lipopolysaccharide heptosyltransferase I
LKILILKPSSLGDVVQALPVLRLLKRHWPASEIYWWVDSSLAPLLDDDPDLAGVVRFERRRWAFPAHWPEMGRSIRWMRAQVFDLVIDLQCLARSGAFAWLANGKFLAGLDERREGARGFYDLAVPRASFHTHAVDWYLGVLKALSVPVHWNFAWLPERPAVAAAVKEKWQTETARWIILQPGARWENKRWPLEYFIPLTRKLAAAHPDFKFAILGSEAERNLGTALAQLDPQRCLDLTGRISLPEMVEWIRLSGLMITNDTGPMHVAAALGKPLVAIFGPTEPRRTGPYGQPGSTVQTRLPCVPCMKSSCANSKPLECLRAIPPDAILALAEEKLAAAARRPAEKHLESSRPLAACHSVGDL